MAVRLVSALALIVALLLATGCSTVQEALTPEPKIVTREATVAVPAAELDGSLEPGLPEDVPLWPKARVAFSDASEEIYNLTLIANEDYDDVLAGLAAGFEDAGWEVMQEQSDEGARTAVLTISGPSAAGVLTVTEREDATVGLVYALTPLE